MERARGTDAEKAGRRPAAEPEPRAPQARAAVDLSSRGLALASLVQTARGRSPIAAQAKRGPGVLSGASPSEGVVQREVIDGTIVLLEGGFPCFNRAGKKYHLNLNETKHVTCDSEGRTHYYYKGEGQGIQDAVGPGKKKKKQKFSDLPSNVQDFIRDNYTAIVSVQASGSIAL